MRPTGQNGATIGVVRINGGGPAGFSWPGERPAKLVEGEREKGTDPRYEQWIP